MSRSKNWHKSIITGVLLAALLLSTSISAGAVENSSGTGGETSEQSTQSQESKTYNEANGTAIVSNVSAVDAWKEQLAATGGLAADWREMAALSGTEQYNIWFGWTIWIDVPGYQQEMIDLSKRIAQRAQPRIDILNAYIDIQKKTKNDITVILKEAGFPEDAIERTVQWVGTQQANAWNTTIVRDDNLETFSAKLQSYYWPNFANEKLLAYGISESTLDSVIEPIGEIIYDSIPALVSNKNQFAAERLRLMDLENLKAFDAELKKDFSSLFKEYDRLRLAQ